MALGLAVLTAAGSSPAPLPPLQALLDRWGRASLPYLSLQMCALAALGMFGLFVALKLLRDRSFPSTEDCLRVALTTVTLLTSVVAVCGLLLPTPPAPPELDQNVLRAVGLTVAVALFSYAAKILSQVFSSKE